MDTELLSRPKRTTAADVSASGAPIAHPAAGDPVTVPTPTIQPPEPTAALTTPTIQPPEQTAALTTPTIQPPEPTAAAHEALSHPPRTVEHMDTELLSRPERTTAADVSASGAPIAHPAAGGPVAVSMPTITRPEQTAALTTPTIQPPEPTAAAHEALSHPPRTVVDMDTELLSRPERTTAADVSASGAPIAHPAAGGPVAVSMPTITRPEQTAALTTPTIQPPEPTAALTTPTIQPPEPTAAAHEALSHPPRTVVDMDTELLSRPERTTAADVSADGAPIAHPAAGDDGPLAGSAGGSLPGIAFVGASDSWGRVVALVNALLAELGALSLDGAGRGALRSLVAVLGRVRAGADAAEARTVTALGGLDDGGMDAVEVLRRNAGSSHREARRRRRRAETLAEMPNVVDALAAGNISPEHADALARAAVATSAEAVDGDAELLAQVAGVPADRAGRHLQTWTQRHQDPADLHEQHLRQRRRRRLHFGDGDDGMLTAHAAFDRVLGAQFRSLINGIADRMWRDEGGRDNPNGRSAEQRRLDALAIAVGLEPAPANPAPTGREDATAADSRRDDRHGQTASPRQQNERTVSPRQQNRRTVTPHQQNEPGDSEDATTASRSQDGPGDGEDATTAESERDDRRRRTASPRQQNGRTASRSQDGPGDGEDATTASRSQDGPGDGEDATTAESERDDRRRRTASPRQQNGRTASRSQDGPGDGEDATTASRSQDGPGDGEDATTAESERDDRRRRTASPRQQNGRTASRSQDGPGDGEDATTAESERDDRRRRTASPRQQNGRTESPRQQNGRTESPRQQNGPGDGEDATTDSGRRDRAGRTESPRQQNGRTVTPRQQNQRTVSPRHQIVIVASADLISGRDPHGRCEIPGVGAIPQSELERLACDAELFGVLFSGDGEPLWHGRGERTATDAQRRALLARDGVCVLCADEPALCESHHIVPWAKPREGPTDIDNLALLCGTCHRRLHNHKRVLTRSADGTWGTAPDPRHTHQPNRPRRHATRPPDTNQHNPQRHKRPPATDP